MAYLTDVIAFAELFADLGSGFDALTVAVFVIVTPRGAVTWTTSSISAPVGLEALNGAKAPMLQVTIPLVKTHGAGG